MYFTTVSMGAQLHTINSLLPTEHIQYIIEDANDRALFVDPSFLDALEPAAQIPAFDSIDCVVMSETVPETGLDLVDYESFIDAVQRPRPEISQKRSP
ncbi:hypothetical protein [Halocatena marina]|uniref:AMP-dependent synthetase/ligase domain-containing protein n=1 Tax=Halocatena marina TaxID=2934937 RepID=A0ABD5YLQ1_9EURY|nr:hypothetical protein [Halocatena marina]